MTRKTFLLRTDPELLAALNRWAADELRSVNAQIEFILRRSLQQAGRYPLEEKHGAGKNQTAPGGGGPERDR